MPATDNHDELCKRLEAVESSKPGGPPNIISITTNWYRNPDGPEAAAAIRSEQAARQSAEAALAVAVEALEREPTPEQIEPFARRWCTANGIDPDAPAAPHGEWPNWYDNAAPFAAIWRDVAAQALATMKEKAGEEK